MKKSHGKSRSAGTISQIINALYHNLPGNIMLNREKLRSCVLLKNCILKRELAVKELKLLKIGNLESYKFLRVGELDPVCENRSGPVPC